MPQFINGASEEGQAYNRYGLHCLWFSPFHNWGYLVNWSVRARVISWVDSLQLTTWKFLLPLHLFSAAFFVSGRAVSVERFWIKCPMWEIFQMGITHFYWMISSADCVCLGLSQWTRSYFGGGFSIICRNFQIRTSIQYSRILKLHHRTWPSTSATWRFPKQLPSYSRRPGAQLSNVGALGSTSRINSPGISAQLGFVSIFEDVMTWWPGAQHQRLCKGGFSNLHGDSKSQHLSWLLAVPSCSPEAAVSPATLVWYPWQLREMGSGEVVHIIPNWDSDSDGSASLVVHKWNRIPIPEAERRRLPTGGRENSLILNKFLFMSSHKCLKYHLQLGIHLPPTWGTDFQAVCSKTPNDLPASHTAGLLMEEIRPTSWGW